VSHNGTEPAQPFDPSFFTRAVLNETNVVQFHALVLRTKRAPCGSRDYLGAVEFF
jgi:hypothetical protein